MPDFVPVLRDEIYQALAENDGIFTSHALQSMKKLDSFLKEMLRHNPASMGTQKELPELGSMANTTYSCLPTQSTQTIYALQRADHSRRSIDRNPGSSREL